MAILSNIQYTTSILKKKPVILSEVNFDLQSANIYRGCLPLIQTQELY